MLTDIYNFVLSLLGTVPVELDFLIPIACIIILFIIFLSFLTPFLFLFSFWRR